MNDHLTAAPFRRWTAPTRLIQVDGPLLVFGGPYSNFEATQALLGAAARLEIPAAHIICTGDVAAYGADAAATMGLLRSAGCHVVMGNCEESLAAGAADCGCGFPAGSVCEHLSGAWFAHATAQLDAESLDWMAQLPRRIDVAVGDYRFAVVHGGVDRINRFLFASTAASHKAAELHTAGLDGIFAGHCGLPFTQAIGGRLWHNPGAIGMPANDGTSRVWYSVVRPLAGGIAIEHRAIEYDYRTAAAKMRNAGLPEEYAAALENGLWPSCDVLPRKEIRERGVCLQPGVISWHRAQRPSTRRAQCVQLWPSPQRDSIPRLDPRKFQDPRITADGAPRASVALGQLNTLWFNTGTLCNIACRNCYIESSPRNDRLAYIKSTEVERFLDEIARDGWPTEEIGFTGGEPFMNPEFMDMLEKCLSRGFRVIVLTNAMRPMQRCRTRLLELNERFGAKLTMRVSLDHFTPERHEDERGPGTFRPTLHGLIWLARNGFQVSVAGRTMWGEDEAAERVGYARLFAEHAIPVDADDRLALVLFPEMDGRADVPEIAASDWASLGKSPSDPMCAHSRMIVKRKESNQPVVVSCTLLPYERPFELGRTLKDATQVVQLNHPHCARFCVLGSASCSAPARRETLPSPLPQSKKNLPPMAEGAHS